MYKHTIVDWLWIGMPLSGFTLLTDIVILIIGAGIHTQSSVLFAAEWIRWSFVPMVVGIALAFIGKFLE